MRQRPAGESFDRFGERQRRGSPDDHGAAPGGCRVARLVGERLAGYLAVDEQEWRFGGRFTRPGKRRYEVRDRWRISLSSGEHGEGLFTADELAELDASLFTYRGDSLRVEWLSGDEAAAAHADHFAGWQ